MGGSPSGSPQTGARPDRGSRPGTPRWVKGFAIIAAAAALAAVLLLTGVLGQGHGPGRHTPADPGSGTPPAGVTEHRPPPGVDHGG
jgi:hypothetical protein